MGWLDLSHTPYPEEDWLFDVAYAEADDDAEEGNPYADAPYDVGKGKPPVHTRFQPGQSGNPHRGPNRPPKTFGEAIYKAASRLMRVVIDGQQETMTRMEVAAEVTVQAATKGKDWAIRRLEKIGEKGETNEEMKQEIRLLKKRIKEGDADLLRQLEESKAKEGGILALPAPVVNELEFQIRHCDPQETFEHILKHPEELKEMLMLIAKERCSNSLPMDFVEKGKAHSEERSNPTKR